MSCQVWLGTRTFRDKKGLGTAQAPMGYQTPDQADHHWGIRPPVELRCVYDKGVGTAHHGSLCGALCVVNYTTRAKNFTHGTDSPSSMAQVAFKCEIVGANLRSFVSVLEVCSSQLSKVTFEAGQETLVLRGMSDEQTTAMRVELLPAACRLYKCHCADSTISVNWSGLRHRLPSYSNLNMLAVAICVQPRFVHLCCLLDIDACENIYLSERGQPCHQLRCDVSRGLSTTAVSSKFCAMLNSDATSEERIWFAWKGPVSKTQSYVSLCMWLSSFHSEHSASQSGYASNASMTAMTEQEIYELQGVTQSYSVRALLWCTAICKLGPAVKVAAPDPGDGSLVLSVMSTPHLRTDCFILPLPK